MDEAAGWGEVVEMGGTIVKWVWVKLLIGNECIYIECALGNEDGKELPLLYMTTHEGYITIFFSPPIWFCAWISKYKITVHMFGYAVKEKT